jgi:hypothetical protein
VLDAFRLLADPLDPRQKEQVLRRRVVAKHLVLDAEPIEPKRSRQRRAQGVAVWVQVRSDENCGSLLDLLPEGKGVFGWSAQNLVKPRAGTPGRKP